MKSLTLTSCTLFAVLMASSSWAMDNTKTICSHMGNSRTIEVIYPTQNIVPCEVRYTKTKGVETLWHAKSEPGYCEKKVAEFVEKQKNWGWSCKLQNTTSAK